MQNKHFMIAKTPLYAAFFASILLSFFCNCFNISIGPTMIELPTLTAPSPYPEYGEFTNKNLFHLGMFGLSIIPLGINPSPNAFLAFDTDGFAFPVFFFTDIYETI